MKIKSEIIWATFLIGTAALSFYLGSTTGSLETRESMRSMIESQTDTINILENKVEQLSEELTSRGIYSYPQANIVTEDNGSTSVVVVTLNGREAIHNLEIESRPTTRNGNGANDNSDEFPPGITANIGTLTAHNPVAFEIEDIGKGIDVDLNFNSRRHQWHQYIRARKTSDGEIKTFWVITNEDMEVIDKHVDTGFPADEDGNLILGKNKKVKFSEIRMSSVFHP